MSAIEDLWVVGQLFQRPPVDDISGTEDSALFDALVAGDRDGVQSILVAGGPIGLREAALLGEAGRVRRLVEAGAVLNPARGWSALHLAAWSGHARVVRELAQAGADLEGRSDVGCTALSLAVAGGRVDVVELLIGCGADPEARDGAGWTPLHQAADAGDLPVVKALLRAGVAVNPRVGSHTPLGLAVRRGHGSVQALLKQVGAV